MKKALRLTTMCVTFVINGCTNDYKPDSKASGEDIFKAVCAECHQPLDKEVPEVLFALHSKNMNTSYIKHKIYTGSIRMPKFPKIKGTKMQSLSTYVLDHSVSR